MGKANVSLSLRVKCPWVRGRNYRIRASYSSCPVAFWRFDHMEVMLEIRPGEGGDDAKMLVSEQAAIYAAYAERAGLAFDLEEDGKS